MSECVFVSVIIPTYRDWDRLIECVSYIQKQTYPKECYEVIIIDNDNDNDNDNVPKNRLELPSNYKLLYEDTPGSYSARNRGIDESIGDVLAFTDSDCRPDSDWISNGVDSLSVMDVERVAGCVRLYYSSSNSNAGYSYEKILAFPQESYVSQGWSITANLFVYKRCFKQIGKFDIKYLSGGDAEWGKRATRKNLKICYSNSVIVSHPARGFSELVSKRRRVAGSLLLQNKPVISILVRAFVPPFRTLKKIAFARHASLTEKTQAIAVALSLHCIALWELILLVLRFKKSQRT